MLQSVCQNETIKWERVKHNTVSPLEMIGKFLLILFFACPVISGACVPNLKMAQKISRHYSRHHHGQRLFSRNFHKVRHYGLEKAPAVLKSDILFPKFISKIRDFDIARAHGLTAFYS